MQLQKEPTCEYLENYGALPGTEGWAGLDNDAPAFHAPPVTVLLHLLSLNIIYPWTDLWEKDDLQRKPWM